MFQAAPVGNASDLRAERDVAGGERKGTEPMTEKQWQGMTEAQRVKAKLWSKRDRLSVPRALFGD